MPAPDVAAATYIPSWRDAALPEPGREIRMKAYFKEGGRTTWREYRVVVASAHLDPMRDDVLVITVPRDGTEYLLDADNRLCGWGYTDDDHDYGALPESAGQASGRVADLENSFDERPPQGEGPATVEDEGEPAMPNPADETITGKIRRLIAVTRRLKALAPEEAALKREKAELSDTIIEMMIDQDMDAPPGVDGMTAYVAPVYFAERKINEETGEPYTSADVLEALREANLAGMITEGYNGNTMKALLREYAETNQEPPEALLRVLTLTKRREVRVTPMAASKRKAAPNRS